MNVKSVKYRIQLGTAFLFLLVAITGIMSIHYLMKLKSQTKNVLQANYETIVYCHQMQKAMDSIRFERNSFVDSFEVSLRNQERNITEKGELEATKDLRFAFDKLKTGDTNKITVQHISYQLQQILTLNMTAIRVKNEKADRSAEDALTSLIAGIAIIFIIGFTFAWNFPSVLITPIQKLTKAIEEIAQKNYSHRIHIDSKDEFGELGNAFNDMAMRLEYFESSNLNKLMFEKNRAESVINSLKDASIGVDKNQTVLFANEQALQLLGLQSAEIVGQSVEDVSNKNDLFKYLMNSDSTSPFKIVVDNRENYFTREVVEVDQGESRSRVITIKNITSFKELDVAKTNFIATISHELKTPLASSDFSLKLLEDERVGNLSAEQRGLVQNIKQDNQRILKILSELLNMSQVETGKIQLNKQKVEPALIVKSAIETVASAAKEKHIVIREALPERLPEIEVDAEKTTWVLNNFLTNAIKYSPAENEIEMAVAKKDGGLIFSVKDFGPGISKEYQSRVFERYFQVPGSKSKGTGLGLAISKEFIEAQGGKIWVESEIGEGTRFLFSLPV